MHQEKGSKGVCRGSSGGQSRLASRQAPELTGEHFLRSYEMMKLCSGSV